MQHEITERTDLLNKKGHLIQKGWAKSLILNYNRKNVNAGKFRIKEWDYYAILHPDFGIAFTIADIGYLGICTVAWLNFKDQQRTAVNEDDIKLFTKGLLNLPNTSENGDVVFKGKKTTMKFEKRNENRILSVDFPEFLNGKGVKGKITLYQDPNMDSMVIATPFKRKTKFYYNQKINCMPAKGEIIIGDQTFTFTEDKCFGVLDWGRGVWTYKNIWYWGSASGLVNGVPFGFNIGYGFGDTSNASENMLFYNGKAHKLDEVEFHINTKNYIKPWEFTSNDGRFEMKFKPIIDRYGKMNLLILKTSQHQVFGHYTGKVKLDNGTELKIKNLLGFAEEVRNRW
ncbi:MAG: DUF2804 domain-containing protein [Promethearchaeota archaeon]